jgi:hypothetical protein
VDDTAFWGLIGRLDWSREGDDRRVVEPVVAALAALPGAGIAAFARILAERLHALDGRAWARESGDLVWWGEPDRLSVDAFLYARCCVVANGRAYYESVLADPERMPKDMEFEVLLSVAPAAFERRTGRPDDGELDTAGLSYETFSSLEGWR